jgi:hypothetical protein
MGTIGAIELRTDDAGYLSAMRPKLYQFSGTRGTAAAVGECRRFAAPCNLEAELNRVST